MKKIVLMPDSFKGTMSSSEICAIMKGRIAEHFPECTVCCIPVADGGEGTVDCFEEAMNGQRVTLSVKGPFMEEVDSFYALVDDGKTAIIEMAAAASLPMAAGREDPRITTTYGVGQLIADAVRRGCKQIIVGLGGSCTNDMGAGAAADRTDVTKGGKIHLCTEPPLSQMPNIADAQIPADTDGQKPFQKFAVSL